MKVSELKTEMDGKFAAVDERFERVDERIRASRQGFERVDETPQELRLTNQVRGRSDSSAF